MWLYSNAVHYDENVFEKAREWNPERFTDRDEYARVQLEREVVAFGHGRKRCTGEMHARAQIASLLAALVSKFDADVRRPDGSAEMPEDHDGPFVFDAANQILLSNLRPRGSKA